MPLNENSITVVTLAPNQHKSDIPNLFEEECFSARSAPLSPSPYNQLPQQQEKPRVPNSNL